MKEIRERNEDTAGYRISELRKDRGWNQKELAEKLYVSPSQISRIESGETESVNIGILISAAELFHVSTDYLLGLTPIMAPKSYDISQLKLSQKAIMRMIFGNIDMDVLNRLLEHDRFPLLCSRIRAYFDDTNVKGIATRNEIIDLATAPLKELAEAADPSKRSEILRDVRKINMQKIGTDEADIEKIKNEFMVILRDVKTNIQSGEATDSVATADVVQGMFKSVQEQAQGHPLTSLSRDNISDALTSLMGNAFPINEEVGNKIKDAMNALIDQFSPENEEGSDE